MTFRRACWANLVIAFLVLGSAYDLITGGAHWPFAAYAMYAEVQRDRCFVAGQLFGVPIDAPDAEIWLHDEAYLHPFDQCRMRIGLSRIESQPEAARLLAEALRNVLQRYESRREQGKHRGPALQSLRYYHVEWQLDPEARHVEPPARKVLKAEVYRD